MSDTIDRTLYHDEEGVDGCEMPGGGPKGHEIGKPRSPDRIITSSGEAPTGGTPVGGASDRVIPGKAVRDAATASNLGPGALDVPTEDRNDRHSADRGDPRPVH